MLNNPFVIAQAKALATRIEKVEKIKRVPLAYQILFSREPSTVELKVGNQFLATEDSAPAPLSRTHRYTQALLASSEFIFVE